MITVRWSVLLAMVGCTHAGAGDSGPAGDSASTADSADSTGNLDSAGGDSGTPDSGDTAQLGSVAFVGDAVVATALAPVEAVGPGGSATLAMTMLSPGSFTMGCTVGQEPGCQADEIAHQVTLTHAFALGTTPVTVAQYRALTGLSPSNLPDCGDDCPVTEMNYSRAAVVANALSEAAGLTACYTCTGSDATVSCEVLVDPYACSGYRLPTEAEWEYGARCGTDLEFAGSADASTVAWTSENSSATPHAVGTLAANGCGLYDMSGNVREWIGDGYAAYGSGAVTDPIGASGGGMRSQRGGSYHEPAEVSHLSNRLYDTMTAAYMSYGVRLAITVPTN